MLGNCLEHVRRTVPLIHNITNYVTVNDVANILLACGGRPTAGTEWPRRWLTSGRPGGSRRRRPGSSGIIPSRTRWASSNSS